jgi:dTDP-glucose 4,6-dehydratase
MTGCCGFIGSNVLNYLCKKYQDVTFVNVDKLDYCATTKNISVQNNSNYYFYKTNICDPNTLLEILKKHRIDTVIHFAAQTHVDNSFGNSVQFTLDNVYGTHVLLECCREYGSIRRFIHISTDEVYGEVEMDEEECLESKILKPTNPYAATKASAEHLVFSYYHSFHLPIIITRGNNVYGQQQYPEKLIPRFIQQLKNNQKCTVHGKGRTVRNFIHVDDVSTAIETILRNGRIGEIYNIGTKNEYSVMDIAKKLIHHIKNTDNIHEHIEYVEDRPFNDLRYSVSNAKLVSLGWNESIPFEDGFKSTIDWYMNCPDDYWINS